jgi:hypothetical protein
MANVAHSSLTGSNLHEPKGVAAATSGKVYVTDGAGSGVFTTLADTDIFGHKLLHIRYEVGSTDANANFYDDSSWTLTLLNTVMTNEISGSSLVSNHVVLPSGTYFVDASLTFGTVGPRALRLRDTTNSVTKVIGLRQAMNSDIDLGSILCLKGRFTLAGTVNLELQVYSSDESAFSTSTDTGEDRVFTDLLIWKIS